MSERQILTFAIASAAVAFVVYRLYTKGFCHASPPVSSSSSTPPLSSQYSVPSSSSSVSVVEVKSKPASPPSSSIVSQSNQGQAAKPSSDVLKPEEKKTSEPPPRGMQLLDAKLTEKSSEKSSEPPPKGMQKISQKPSQTINPYGVQTPAIPRFDRNDVKAMEYLDKNGYVVIKSVMSEDEIAAAKPLFWDYIEQVTKGAINRKDLSTWTNEAWPGSIGTGILSSYGIGQSSFLWYIRGIPAIKEAFAKVWDTDDLLVSFDGCGAFRPWSYDAKWKTTGGWYHVDQNFQNKPGKHCVQGLVTLYDATPKIGGLVVVPKSHLQHAEIAARLDLEDLEDFVMIPPGDPSIKEPAHLVQARAGDLILWDSRTIHCNSPALEVDEQPENKEIPADLIRLVAYICMTPAQKASPEVLKEREQAVKKGQGTNHWPHEFHEMGSNRPWPGLTLNQYQSALVHGKKQSQGA